MFHKVCNRPYEFDSANSNRKEILSETCTFHLFNEIENLLEIKISKQVKKEQTTYTWLVQFFCDIFQSALHQSHSQILNHTNSISRL